MTRLLFPQSAILDILERLLTTPFYCWKFAPFCERHSFLCIVAVCWWKNEAYTDWYYSILLLSVIINRVTIVTDDFIFAKMERITKLLTRTYSSWDNHYYWVKTVMCGCSCPLSCPSTILAYSCYSSQFAVFCHISRLSLPFPPSNCRILLNLLFLLFLLKFFSHRKKNSCYFCDFCEICGHLEALLDLFSL